VRFSIYQKDFIVSEIHHIAAQVQTVSQIAGIIALAYGVVLFHLAREPKIR